MSIEVSRQTFHSLSNELNDLLLLDASDMFHGIIAYQSKLSVLTQEECNEHTYVHGCISNAYVVVEEHDEKAKIRGTSDAMIIQGLMGVMAFGFSFLSIAELAQEGQALIQEFIRSIDLHIMLTPTRANAFGNIVQKIIDEARLLSNG